MQSLLILALRNAISPSARRNTFRLSSMVIYSQISELVKRVSEANRSVPSYVALSEQGEWLVGKMAENYAVCLQNVIYGYFKVSTRFLQEIFVDIRWLLGKTNGEIDLVQDKKRYFFKRPGNLPDDG